MASVFALTIHASSRTITRKLYIIHLSLETALQLPLAVTRKVTMAKYRIMYWKHIPQSIIVEGDGRTVKKQLSQKIQNSIDTYAMAEGLTSTSDYAHQFKRGDWIERDGAPEEIAETLLSELETEFDKIEMPKRNGNTAQGRDNPTPTMST